MKNLLVSDNQLRFVEKTHKYFLGDVELPSITTILSKLGLTKNYEGIDKFYANRGTSVHRCIELDIGKRLDEASVDPVCAPYLAAWRKFMAETGFEPLGTEKMVHSEEVGFAGRIDYLGKMKGEQWLLDAKCTKQHDPGSDFQLCGQAYGLKEMGEQVDRMGILELHEDQTYSLCEYKVDMLVWPAVMKLWNRKFKKET